MQSQIKQCELKEKVFQSAWQIVKNEGMDQLTIRGIAELSNCSLGSIYTVFDNFQDLQLRINARILSDLYRLFNEAADNAIQNNKEIQELFKSLAKVYIGYGQQYPFLWKALFEHIPSNPFPDWYRKHTHDGLHLLSNKLKLTFSLSETEVRTALGFFWASIHGISSILLNKKLEMVAEFFNADIHLDPYIEYCLSNLFSIFSAQKK